MSLEAKVGYLDVNPGVANQDVTPPGLTVQPKLGIFWGTDIGAADGSAATPAFAFGAVDAVGNQASLSSIGPTSGGTYADGHERQETSSVFRTHVANSGALVTRLTAPGTWAS